MEDQWYKTERDLVVVSGRQQTQEPQRKKATSKKAQAACGFSREEEGLVSGRICWEKGCEGCPRSWAEGYGVRSCFYLKMSRGSRIPHNSI